MFEDLKGERFGTIVADPPWRVRTGPIDFRTSGKSRPLDYPTMPIGEIRSMPVSDLALPVSHLYLWTINKYVEDAYDVARAWGFTPSTLLVWAKRPMGLGLGGAYSLTTEFCLYARRGTYKPDRRIDSTWWLWPRGRHSKKPEAFQDMVEQVSPGPYLELYARRHRPGWSVWGNEVGIKQEPEKTTQHA